MLNSNLEVVVGARDLGVGLLQQGAPELVLVLALDVDEPAVDGGQVVVHHDVDPLPVEPQP